MSRSSKPGQGLLLLLALAIPALPQQESPRQLLIRAEADFLAGRVAESLKSFDRLAQLVPAQAPHLWQRGIALYYAGRFEDCRAQFESHRSVNPNDVENAAWHFLCVARLTSPPKARAAILPVGPDPRVPMREVFQMFRGELTAEKVLAAAGADPGAQFYAHLYIGLYAEASGNAALAEKHITAAAQDRYTQGGYMHSVAKVHVAQSLDREANKKRN